MVGKYPTKLNDVLNSVLCKKITLRKTTTTSKQNNFIFAVMAGPKEDDISWHIKYFESSYFMYIGFAAVIVLYFIIVYCVKVSYIAKAHKYKMQFC